MTRRRNHLDDVIGEMVMTGFILAGTIAVLAGIAIANALKTSTLEKLHRLTPAEQWGTAVSGRACPGCGSPLVSAGTCPVCEV